MSEIPQSGSCAGQAGGGHARSGEGKRRNKKEKWHQRTYGKSITNAGTKELATGGREFGGPNQDYEEEEHNIKGTV